jgi:hypothetical protein
MPGSPYIDEVPKGLLTWPKLLLYTVPTFTAITAVSVWQNLLLEWFVLLSVGLFVAAWLRK